MQRPIPVAELLRAQTVETRYVESDGTPFRDIHPLEKLPEIVDEIQARGGKLLGVRRFESSGK